MGWEYHKTTDRVQNKHDSNWNRIYEAKLVQKHGDKRVHEVAFENLIIKKNDGQKGLFIQYEKSEMAAYLSSKSNISVTDKLEMFAIRCEMNDLP